MPVPCKAAASLYTCNPRRLSADLPSCQRSFFKSLYLLPTQPTTKLMAQSAPRAARIQMGPRPTSSTLGPEGYPQVFNYLLSDPQEPPHRASPNYQPTPRCLALRYPAL